MPIRLKVVAPDKVIADLEAESVRIETEKGSMGILAGHIPVAAKLKRSRVHFTVYGKENSLPVPGGFAKVTADSVTVFTQ